MDRSLCQGIGASCLANNHRTWRFIAEWICIIFWSLKWKIVKLLWSLYLKIIRGYTGLIDKLLAGFEFWIGHLSNVIDQIEIISNAQLEQLKSVSSIALEGMVSIWVMTYRNTKYWPSWEWACPCFSYFLLGYAS